MRKVSKILSLVLVMFVSIVALAACSSKNQAKDGSKFKSVSTKELKSKLDSKEWVIVDTRENDAFNGWKLDGVKRGGHIKGATDFSAAWLKVEDKEKDKKLDEALKAKGIVAEKTVVLYDANGKDSNEVGEFLSKKGYKKIYRYDVKEWAADESLAMESYPVYKNIVPASWVKDLIDGKKPETYTGSQFKIFEVGWGDESKSKDYLKTGHIKGAVHINTDEVEEGPLWNRLSDDKLQKFAENNGITVDTSVILYGSDSTPAYRVAAILRYMGVKDVRVLNGGFAKWKSAGYELEKTSNKKVPVASFGAKVPVNKNLIVDLPGAKEILADRAGSSLVDIRSWDEHIGKVTGYDYIKFKGRPAGSVWGHDLKDYRNIDNTMLNKNQIVAMWKEWNITPEQKLSFFCGTGWRAAEVLFYAEAMGVKNISLYDGGWNEWSGNTGNAQNPVETGEPNTVEVK